MAQNTIEKIRAEIERQRALFEYNGKTPNERTWRCLGELLSFIDTLKEPEKPMNPNEDVFKIWGTTEKEYLAKSMDKVHLEMEIATYLKDWEDDEEIGLHLSTDNGCITIELEDVRDIARHFAKWQAEHAPLPEDTVIFNKGIEEGKRLMMEDAVEGEVHKYDKFSYVKEKNSKSLTELLAKFNNNDKVRIIIVKKDEK